MPPDRKPNFISQRSMTMTENWQFWAILAAAFAALTTIFGKVGIENVPADYGTFVRTVVIVIFAGAIAWRTTTHDAISIISTRSYAFLGLSGLATGASWLCYYRALQLGPASRVAPIDKLSVAVVAVMGVIFFGEVLSPKQVLGVALVTFGALLML
ncbi:hypothetical protein PB2503_00465 [Parvularcula bermudensis HTCC2503]|uniref:EamA domain-containing protein n=2 Tax=Parvularcula TaxID=208215 RepID=E0TIK2_PARBH|nr:hypothetical protein PB2503_00465 [Parvularcula bermudensis HTCC2503]